MSKARREAGGISAGWVVALVIGLTLGLGTAFFVVANSHPVELVDVSSRVEPAAETKVEAGRRAPTSAPAADTKVEAGRRAPTSAPAADTKVEAGRRAPTSDPAVPR